MRKTSKLVFVLFVSLCLLACGGGGSTIDEVASVSGKIIDGYVSGATVFLDLNLNGDLDADEPSAISAEKGYYKLKLTKGDPRCIDYVPVVVDVPVGAMDEDLGEVTEAYKMTIPPQIGPMAGYDARNITPLTSLLWDIAQTKLLKKHSHTKLKCKDIMEDMSILANLQNEVDLAISDAMARYSLTEEQLYNDFISAEDGVAQNIATEAVVGLKKGLEEKLALKASNPTADYIKVSYHKADSRDNDYAYPDAWYRESYIAEGDNSYFELAKISDDLSTIVRPIISEDIAKEAIGDDVINTSYGYESRLGDDSGYTCDSKEAVIFSYQGVEYEVVNLVSRAATVASDCIVSSFDTEAYGRYIFVNGVQHTFRSRPFDNLNGWFDFKDNIQQLDQSAMAAYADSLVSQ